MQNEERVEEDDDEEWSKSKRAPNHHQGLVRRSAHMDGTLHARVATEAQVHPLFPLFFDHLLTSARLFFR